MGAENKTNRVGWIVMLILSILFLVWTIPLLTLSGGQIIFEQGLKYADSPFNVASLDPAALGYINLSMLKPLWEEIWIGIFGIYCAFSLKANRKHARLLSFAWGIMLITNAAIQGVYEVVFLDWSSACLQTYLFLALGTIAIVSLLLTRVQFSLQPAQDRSK